MTYGRPFLTLNMLGDPENQAHLRYTINLALVVQSCPTLCDSMNCRLPGSSVHGIL